MIIWFHCSRALVSHACCTLAPRHLFPTDTRMIFGSDHVNSKHASVWCIDRAAKGHFVPSLISSRLPPSDRHTHTFFERSE